MSFRGWWKSAAHSALDSNSLDEIDEIIAGKIFKIRYLGCTIVDHKEKCDFNKTAEEMLRSLPGRVAKKLPVLNLFIDPKLLSVTDTKGGASTLLDIPLSDIRDTLYRKNDSRYDKICIFVARYLPLSSNLKAHVLYCDTSSMAEQLFETFRLAFEVVSRKTCASHVQQLDIPVCPQSKDLENEVTLLKKRVPPV